MSRSVKARVYDILNVKNPDDSVTGLVSYFLIENILPSYLLAFTLLETFSVLAFTVEYLLRLWVSTQDLRYKKPVLGRLKYAFTNVLAIADLLAILPFYLPMIGPIDLIFLKALRLFRLSRIFKLARYSDSLDILERVINRQKEHLVLTSSSGSSWPLCPSTS